MRWDQRDNTGLQVPAGRYAVSVSCTSAQLAVSNALLITLP